VMPSGRVDEPPRFGDVSLKGVATPPRGTITREPR
jgi:hypothetical protein